MDHNCKEQNRLERIENKLDRIDEKLDSFLDRLSVTETKLGFITTGLVILLAPILSGIALYFLTGG